LNYRRFFNQPDGENHPRSTVSKSTPKPSIQVLHASLPRGAPFGTAELARLGISPGLAHRYVASGWLVRLGRGVFMFAGDQLQAGPSVRFLSRHVAGLHVGGKTALAWRGVRHNVGPSERLSLWGTTPGRLPPWFVDRFPATYTAKSLFTPRLPADFGLQPLPEMPDGPDVAAPERALLELLSTVGLGQGVEEARNIMEGLRTVRSDVLGRLLKHCPRVKVVRLCVQWAEELNLAWAAEARVTAGRRGKGRWLARMPDGTTLILKP
jgi:Transcriptional regulator, AbiEi antitoxin, Type IV TA system/Transcriptional regulator, AbiEi antitoxin N-terminal domain